MAIISTLATFSTSIDKKAHGGAIAPPFFSVCRFAPLWVWLNSTERTKQPRKGQKLLQIWKHQKRERATEEGQGWELVGPVPLRGVLCPWVLDYPPRRGHDCEQWRRPRGWPSVCWWCALWTTTSRGTLYPKR